ncbi:hypothetical protein MLD38_036322 [Melastoma candidum]|uniref:Uncharacterized protein n=1 Tax=Melastoma candidum TaxID=119954 RepID=A0ACB9LJC1_9MYRT|nr:hypothetical protein MLD38_036322 [Melastoma candidum]
MRGGVTRNGDDRDRDGILLGNVNAASYITRLSAVGQVSPLQVVLLSCCLFGRFDYYTGNTYRMESSSAPSSAISLPPSSILAEGKAPSRLLSGGLYYLCYLDSEMLLGLGCRRWRMFRFLTISASSALSERAQSSLENNLSCPCRFDQNPHVWHSSDLFFDSGGAEGDLEP